MMEYRGFVPNFDDLAVRGNDIAAGVELEVLNGELVLVVLALQGNILSEIEEQDLSRRGADTKGETVRVKAEGGNLGDVVHTEKYQRSTAENDTNTR